MLSAQANTIYNQCAGRVRSFRSGGCGGCKSAREKESEHWIPLSSTREFSRQTDVTSAESKQAAVSCESNVTAHHTLRVFGVVGDGAGRALLALVLLEPLEPFELVVSFDVVGRKGSRCGRCLAGLLVLELAAVAEVASARCVEPPANAMGCSHRSAGGSGFALQAGDGFLHPAGVRSDRVQGVVLLCLRCLLVATCVVPTCVVLC